MLLHSVREKSQTFSIMAVHRFSSTKKYPMQILLAKMLFLMSVEKNSLTYNHGLNKSLAKNGFVKCNVSEVLLIKVP